MAFLSMSRMTKRFGATLALDRVGLNVDRGEVLALVGENGSGKSTLMRILSGAIQADEGQMFLDGRPFAPSGPSAARNRGVSMIYQELALCPDLSVTENVLLGQEMARVGVIDQASQRLRTQSALSQLGYGSIDVDAPVRSFPIAIRQIIEIARAVALGSSVVVLDEPTSSLSREDVTKLFRVLENLKHSGHAIIYITHFLDEIKQIADRILVLRDGKNVGNLSTEESSTNDIVSLMVGRPIEDAYPRSARQPSEVILDFSQVSGREKPIDASLELRCGEVVGIAGLNGSGRTELIRVLFGLDPIRSGKVRLGVHEGIASPNQRWRQGLGMLSEDRKEEGLALNMSIADNLTLTELPTFMDDQSLANTTQKWIDEMKIKCRAPFQAVGELSGGNQQKVALARLLYHDVDVLLLDEPTRGIDIGSKELIYSTIDELAKQGKAVLLVSSYLPELLGVCDRVAVMHKGQLTPAMPVASCTQDSLMRLAAGA